MAAKQVSKKKQLEEEQAKLKKIDDPLDEQEFEYVTIPPDGGFGWVVALAAMVRPAVFSRFDSPIILHRSLEFRCVILCVMVLSSPSVR